MLARISWATFKEQDREDFQVDAAAGEAERREAVKVSSLKRRSFYVNSKRRESDASKFTLFFLLKGQSLARTLGGWRLESEVAGLIPWV